MPGKLKTYAGKKMPILKSAGKPKSKITGSMTHGGKVTHLHEDGTITTQRRKKR